MQRMIDMDGMDIVLDTEADTWIYLAPRPESDDDQRFERGRDLFIKERAGGQDIYYIYRWTLIADEDESIHMVTRKAAERFLEEHGLVLASYPNQRGSDLLRSYGYGMLEEF
jgi:hypothetical protein